MRSERTSRKMGNQRLVSPSRQCSSTPVSFRQEFLNEEKGDSTGASPYSPVSAAADSYLFSPLKSALKWRRFCDATDINKNATEELKRFSLTSFLVRSQRFYGVYLCKGTIVKEIQVKWLYYFIFLKNKLTQGIFWSYHLYLLHCHFYDQYLLSIYFKIYFIYIYIYIYINVKCSRYRPGVAQSLGRVIALLFYDRGIKRGWVVSITLRPHFSPLERPGTHFTEGWVGPRAGLDGRKISSPPGFDPRPSSP